MASYVGEVVIGDYRYTLYDDRTARARVTDDTKTSYGALRSSVTYSGVTYRLTSLSDCFYDCFNMTTAPTIPDGVTNMSRCFYQCFEITTAPEIPEGATNLYQCFYNCYNLTTVASVPSTATTITDCFRMCSALTGTIRVAGEPTYYGSCFSSTNLPIILDATRTAALSTWRAVAATSNRGNVTVTYPSDNPAPTGTINATRVASAGSTTSDESGRYVYVQVATTVSTDRAPYNVAQAPTITVDGTTVTPTQTSGTASWRGWVALSDDYAHTIGATPNDLYKSGITVTATLPSTYSPMEFHATGDGASFGKHATRSGVLDVAWDIESDGDVSAAGDVADGTGTLDEVRQDVAELQASTTETWSEKFTPESGYALRGGSVTKRYEVVRVDLGINVNKAITKGNRVKVGTITDASVLPASDHDALMQVYITGGIDSSMIVSTSIQFNGNVLLFPLFNNLPANTFVWIRTMYFRRI